jgi:type IV pilus assembly protein PilA
MPKLRNKKGFTLIELLIVVAIIAILAAVAIPQFIAYRVKGYNSAAGSDIRNGKTVEESLYADFQGYGNTLPACTAGLGTVLTSSPATICFTDATAQIRSLDCTVSNGVGILANTDANNVSYVIFTKHKQGNRIFAADNNDTVLRSKAGTLGVDLVTGDGVASTTNVDITTAGYTAL